MSQQMKTPQKNTKKAKKASKQKEENGPIPEENEQEQEIEESAPRGQNLIPVQRIISGLFKSIAIEESEIERLRQDLAQVREFDCQALFDRINTDRNDHINATEMLRFLQDNYVKNVTLEDCQAIIDEFDSSADGTMQFFEFQNLLLPAANQSLRDYIQYRRMPSYMNDQNRPLAISVSSLTVRILEHEIRYQNVLSENRRELFKHKDYQKNKTFNELSRGMPYVSMNDLIYFLENNGFYPRTEDLEAILRRCDHDADRALNFEEFCEITQIPGEEETESIVHDTVANNNSPVRREIQEDVQNTELRRSNSNDRLDANPNETIEQSQARKDAEQREKEWREEIEKREAEYKQAQQRKYDGSSKLISFIQEKLHEFINVDYQKKLLSYHGAFNCMKLFQDMDTEQKGHLTAQNFQNYFGQNEDFIGFNFSNLVKHLNGGSEEDKVGFVELQDALTPYSNKGQRGFTHSYGGSYSRKTPEQQQVQEDSWKGQLNLIVYLICQQAKCDQDGNQEETSHMTIEECQAIWEDLDNYRYGYISTSSIQRWLSDFAEFNIPFEDLHYLYDCFNVREVEGRINEDQFVKILAGKAAFNEEQKGTIEDNEEGKWFFCEKTKKWTKN